MNYTNNKRILTRSALVLAILGSLAGCGSDNDDTTVPSTTKPPQLSPAVGVKMTGSCSDLLGFQYNNTVISSATLQEAGTLNVANKPIGAHCLVKGYMDQRVSPVDGQTYQIGFEMRLPIDWNGRFLYQGNGGTDGNLVPATGQVGSGGPLTNALHDGFAVISSDAGHNASQNPMFGLDPQARINYGYGAITKLTPMAKNLIKAAYGKLPDRSYAGGTSNGGRHAMIAATRLGDQYDGILASTPGFHLPRAAAAQLYTAQQLRRVATDENDLSTALTLPERKVLAKAILDRCDALDGVTDGLVQDVEACRTAFNIHKHVPVCSSTRDGTCLSTEQIDVLANIYRGPVNSAGQVLYATQPFDPGLVGSNWASWKFESSVGTARDPVAVGILFQVPPDPTVTQNSRQFAFNFNFDTDYSKLSATNDVYTESSMSFMMPPDELNLDKLRNHGGKMIVVQGTADGVFSVDDTQNWYDQLLQHYKNDAKGTASEFARFFRVPGMNHTRDGIATDQFDALTALVNWVEYGQAPDKIIATARGAGNPSGQVNTELPQDWAPDRTRPLCPYPLIARYNGQGDSEKAENFSCK
ncbi:tannase/feruloyl esterase family alpha/beta hydrolase [Acinetobacter baumannii]|uniref:tannase/feruloyl esterase family alpha/beta hydrolase n=1 Tax=Acinetobacter baumannii TaxID=470 RepID=UPI00286FBD03|nr:tannase/feruloyl esterase family alpha/beta hydrolase [Acinetobacter baumannii]MDR9623878.1 tannase/feruloyl esterase family alpha/beta hydrolase [Acinetobacter baumannii]